MDNLIPTKTIKENGVIAIKNGIKPNPNKHIPIERKPKWLRIKSQNSSKFRELKEIVSHKKLHTVCEEAMCPNIQECWSHGTATFMLLGSVCTRACKFCAVDTGNPKGQIDAKEPEKVANSIAQMNLKYAVLTSVNRDDLEDGGAMHFAQTVVSTKKEAPGVIIEALVPDFLGKRESIETLLDSNVEVFAQNLETVKRLTHQVRDHRAGYEQTLEVLAYAKKYSPKTISKTSLMLGLGESEDELLESFNDIRSAGVDVLTLGQYMRPTINHLPVEKWYSPEEFQYMKKLALDIGFKEVASGPLVRSSYRADKIAHLIKD
ncbi:MAG: lipoyl synthase [Pseudomonadota bacterium]|nr:lipoyl synthase [Pseudomonadota bacterium]GIR87705.1 MAG: lipoyl synthase [Gammaproteobacteria bacterium]